MTWRARGLIRSFQTELQDIADSEASWAGALPTHVHKQSFTIALPLAFDHAPLESPLNKPRLNLIKNSGLGPGLLGATSASAFSKWQTSTCIAFKSSCDMAHLSISILDARI